MNVQKSFETAEEGKLFLVATPIGNLKDMTYRAVETLKSVNLIACEDTRKTRKLLTHFEIKTPFMSYHEHNQREKEPEILKRLTLGEQVALVSDAGLPAISDPGEALVRAAVEAGIAVIPIPGANAALSALVVSGLSTRSFTFLGFLPRKKSALQAALKQLRERPETLILYESPYRVKLLLSVVQEELGNRYVVLAREMTKRFEEVVRADVSECLRWLEENPPRGEYTVLIEGIQGQAQRDAAGRGDGREAAGGEVCFSCGSTREHEGSIETFRAIRHEVLNHHDGIPYRTQGEQAAFETPFWQALSLHDHVDHYLRSGMKPVEAVKQAALDRGIPKREVYRAYHQANSEL